jgi:glycine oxidase
MTLVNEDTGIDPEYIQSGLLMMDEYDTLKAQTWIDKYKVTTKLQS